MASARSATLFFDGDWSKSCPNNRFCFEHPQTLIDSKLPVIDSIAGEYRDEQMQLIYDMGWYASQFDELPDALIEPIIIDGKQGEILITDNVMALRIPQIDGKIRFSMMLTFTDKVNVKVGRRIFISLKFISNSNL